MSRAKRRARRPDPAAENVAEGWLLVGRHPLFAPLVGRQAGRLRREEGERPREFWASVRADGVVEAHPTRLADPQEWAWVFAHCLLHLGFGHVVPTTGRTATGLPYGDDDAGRAACEVAVNRFLAALRLGRPPWPLPDVWPSADERTLARRWRQDGVPADLAGLGVAGPTPCMLTCPPPSTAVDWEKALAIGLGSAVTAAVDVAGGVLSDLSGREARVKKPWERALSRFVGGFPLLGAVASSLKLVADPDVARTWRIAVAAVSAEAGEVYVNPVVHLTEDEWYFVLAHEMLHAALRHGARVGGRDPFLWNVAADFVVNDWLVEMKVGAMPAGLLHDVTLRGLSVETVYERITVDLRRLRRLATLRGHGLGDVLDHPLPHPGESACAADLDAFYRSALCTGLEYHLAQNRGFVPEGLVEEIRALEQSPLPWDARLARWFDEHVPSVAPVRSFARASRRQASTPDIPRPGRYRPVEEVPRVTFGVVLDTSGSMDRTLLGKGLGAIASYAAARDVPAARVVFCDAAAYDEGYLPPEDIAGRVRVRGRGGTVLQPGLDLLERAQDFPKDAPVLVVTDGWCDAVRTRREHAFLVPAGATLPFSPQGPVFRMT